MKNKAIRVGIYVLIAYLILGLLFHFIAGDSLRATADTTSPVSPKAVLGEFVEKDTIKQPFVCEYDSLTSIGVLIGTNARKNSDTIHLSIWDNPNREGEPLYQSSVNAESMKDNTTYVWELGDKAIQNAAGKTFYLELESENGRKGNSISLYYGNTINAGRFSVAVDVFPLEVNGEPRLDDDDNPCSLCLTLGGIDYHWVGTYYWYLYGGGALLLALYILYVLYCKKHEKKCVALSLIGSMLKYRFLMKQLVARDFKTKYKRSVLGVLWSFLNPLLTMSIQFVIFSTLFKSDIDNFVVYLLTGIICFNFFSEAANMCLMSIIGNATLINKVYVPKYIYPLSRSLSSGINLLLSLIPLLLMLLITKTPITPAILLLPFALIMLFLFSYGVGLILATMMVFFRDTQFLWNIFSMLLMYLTPIFYPETIIPTQFLWLYRLNPMYQIITFVRTILIEGISPGPAAYLGCILVAVIPLLIGLLIFKKNEDKFVLNI